MSSPRRNWASCGHHSTLDHRPIWTHPDARREAESPRGEIMACILVVDDEPMLRRTLRGILEKAGHTVVEAGDGDQALVAFASSEPDLVITDIIMPNREGVEMIGELR